MKRLIARLVLLSAVCGSIALVASEDEMLVALGCVPIAVLALMSVWWALENWR